MSLDQYDSEDLDQSDAHRRGGAVARLIPGRGFGFIVDPAGQEYFFHISNVENVQGIYALRDGDQVSFAPRKGPKGWVAEAIRVLGTASEAGRQAMAPKRPRPPRA